VSKITIAAGITAALIQRARLLTAFKPLQLFERIAAVEVQRATTQVLNGNAGTLKFGVLTLDRDVQITKVEFIADIVAAADASTLRLFVGETAKTAALTLNQAHQGTTMALTVSGASLVAGETLSATVVAASGATVRGTVVVHYRPAHVPL
jgi:hypothetical protein